MAPYPFGTPDQVSDLDPGNLIRGWERESLLGQMAAEQRDIDAAEARKLVAVTRWADLHRSDVAESHAGAGLLPGHDDHSMPIVMSGVPVDEFCLAELSAALRVTHGAARALTEQGLELRERLPRLWDKTQEGLLPTWKARAVARETLSLPDDAADFVDRQLAPFARTLTVTRIKNLVAVAILRFDPARAGVQEAEAGERRGVWFDLEHGGDALVGDASRPNGTGRVEAVADIPDLLAFKDALEQKAREQEILGDTDSDNVRMAKAIGILADPQYALDLTATVQLVLDEQAEPPLPDRRPSRVRSPFGAERPIHVHLHTSSRTARIQASGLPHAGSPIAREAIERWIRELAPGAKVNVTPVVNLNRHHAVDQYEAPDFTRSLVDERDDACVFPFCTNRGRFDLDHIEEYVDPDDGGPPGQTSNLNLGKLCRYHHRAKTHTTWTYKRVGSVHDIDTSWADPGPPSEFEAGPGRAAVSVADRGGPPAAYAWTSPMGLHYLVTSTGTYPLD